MQLATSPRTAFLRDLRAEIMHNYPAGRVIIAVDGPEGSGTDAFADDLAAVYGEAGTSTARASMRDFHHARATRHAHGRRDPSDYYERSFDYETLRRVLIDPFRMAGSTGFQTTAFDVGRDAPVVASWHTGPADMVLVLDGPFLLRPEIRTSYHVGIYLDVPLETVYERLAAVQGRDADPDAWSNSRYVGGWRHYERTVQPQYEADIVVGLSEPDLPRREYPQPAREAVPEY